MEDTIVVGRDMRPHSPDLAKALIDGIRSVGMNVIDVGMIDTSFIYFAINHLDCVGGIMTTASHNPIQYNGFKISGPKAKPIGSASGLDDIKRIADHAQPRRPDRRCRASTRSMDLWAAVPQARPPVPRPQAAAQGRDRRQQRHGRQDGAEGLRQRAEPRDRPAPVRDHRQLRARARTRSSRRTSTCSRTKMKEVAGRPRRLLRRRRRPLHVPRRDAAR